MEGMQANSEMKFNNQDFPTLDGVMAQEVEVDPNGGQAQMMYSEPGYVQNQQMQMEQPMEQYQDPQYYDPNAGMYQQQYPYDQQQQYYQPQHQPYPQYQPRQQNQKLFKTQMCRYYLQNQDCKHGANCSYAHGEGELRTLEQNQQFTQKKQFKKPWNYKTVLCKFFQKGQCPREKDDCSYAHGEDDLRTAEAAPPKQEGGQEYNPYGSKVKQDGGYNPYGGVQYNQPQYDQQAYDQQYYQQQQQFPQYQQYDQQVDQYADPNQYAQYQDPNQLTQFAPDQVLPNDPAIMPNYYQDQQPPSQ